MKHFRYLSYVVRHKWFVFQACLRRGIVWQGIIHDWSKFLPSEWFPYVEFFYGFKPEPALERYARSHGLPIPDKEQVKRAFDIAWLRHQHHSPHHWQHWILRNDNGSTVALEMPLRFVLEMLADWEGAGRAITGRRGTTPEWYARNRANMHLHPATRAFVDRDLGFVEPPTS